MPILTTISGIPLFSTPQEANQWALANGQQGFHTHMYQGVLGYMGGATHGAAASSSQGLNGANVQYNQNNNNNNNNNTGGGGY